MSAIASISSDPSLTGADALPASTGIIQIDHDSSDANNTVISFGDFLDMVNPLQHIPVLSAAYRAVTGDTISPTARIAGDALYSGILGLASAGISAVAALGDEVYAANNDGQGVGASVVASLFGRDAATAQEPANDSNDPAVMLAATPTTPIPTDAPPEPDTAPFQTAFLQTPAKQSPILTTSLAPTETPKATTANPSQLTATELTAAHPTTEQIAAAQAALSPNLAAAARAASATSDPTLGLALNRSKAPYGGALDTSMMQNALQNQTLALALANGKNTLQGEHAVRNNRFAAGPAATSTTSTSAAPTLTTSASTITTPSSRMPVTSAVAPATPLPTATATPAPFTNAEAQDPIQATLSQLQAMRSLSRYRSTAQSLPVTGSSLDVVN